MLDTVALALMVLTGPDDQVITVVPSSIVSMRAPRGNEHFAHGVKCLINTVDGKFITVIEDCDTVRERMGE